MPEISPHGSCLAGCQSTVPLELAVEHVCVLHFLSRIERACAEMRRESALDRLSPARRSEIADYVKATAMKLSCVATGSLRLSDELKKRVLTTFLTLMNLQESLDRSASRWATPGLRAPAMAAVG